MKFLHLASLASLSSVLNDIETDTTQLCVRLEAYSCKRAGADKKLYVTLESQYKKEVEEKANSYGNGNELSLSCSPFGPMVHKRCRETLIELISTLNAAFPDYDFSESRGDQFSKEEVQDAVNKINANLSDTVPNFETLRQNLWTTIDQEIDVKECAVYSFTPDNQDNPFEEDGSVWSFNYFFYNKRGLKRILLFSCTAQLKDRADLDSDLDSKPREVYDINGDFNMDLLMEFDSY